MKKHSMALIVSLALLQSVAISTLEAHAQAQRSFDQMKIVPNPCWPVRCSKQSQRSFEQMKIVPDPNHHLEDFQRNHPNIFTPSKTRVVFQCFWKEDNGTPFGISGFCPLRGYGREGRPCKCGTHQGHVIATPPPGPSEPVR